MAEPTADLRIDMPNQSTVAMLIDALSRLDREAVVYVSDSAQSWPLSALDQATIGGHLLVVVS